MPTAFSQSHTWPYPPSPINRSSLWSAMTAPAATVFEEVTLLIGMDALNCDEVRCASCRSGSCSSFSAGCDFCTATEISQANGTCASAMTDQANQVCQNQVLIAANPRTVKATPTPITNALKGLIEQSPNPKAAPAQIT